MSRTGGNDANTQPRLVTVLVDADERGGVVDSLRERVLVVGRHDLDEAAAARADGRRDGELEAIAALEAEVRSLTNRRTQNESIHADLVVEQRRIREAADWCEMQPARDREEAEQIAASTETLETHSRTVRDANRQLERVLEQRAAAEAALEEARSQLGSLGAAGVDETDVRRQMEAASRLYHEVSTEYQECMAEVARRKAVVWDLEDAAAVRESRQRTDAGRDSGDQLQAMRAAVHAKFAPPEPTAVAIDPAQIDAARAELAEAEATADEIAARLARAKTEVASLENEMSIRTQGVDSREARHAAALELEEQVAAVEHQLGEAEVRSRAEVEEATRAMSRAELTLERLRNDARDRRKQLRTYAALSTEAQRPPAEDDPVLHAKVIARALRTHAEAMQPDLDHAAEVIERDRALTAGKEAEIEDLRVRLESVLSEDRAGAIQDLAGTQETLAIDDIVIVDDDEDAGLTPECLLRVDTDATVIVLTTDPAVVGWAIEQPADRAGVTSVASLRTIGSPDRATH